MKKFTFLSVLLLAIAMLATAASAQLTLESATLGSDSANPGDTVSDTVVLTNTGATTVNGINVTTTVGSEFDITFSGVPSTLAPGASATITVQGEIPADADAVDSNLDDKALTVGRLVATGNNGAAVSVQSDLNVQVENHLEIKNIIISVNGEDEHSLDDGDDLDNLKPGDQLKITIEIENTYDDDEDFNFDIDNAEITLDVDSDIDLDDDSIDDIEISPDDSTEESVDADVDMEASGSYTLRVSVKGTSDDGAFHGQEISVDLKVDRESHEISVESATLTPSKVPCGTSTVTAKVGVMNIGKSNEDEVAIEVRIPSLNIVDRKDAIELDKNDELSRSFALTLPSNVKAGTYQVEIQTYFNDDVESDGRVMTLEVLSCDSKPVAVIVPTTPVVTTPPTTTPTTTVVSSRGNTQSFWDTGLGLTTMVIGIIAAIVIIVALIMLLVRKPE